MKTLSILQRLFLFVILLQTHQNKKNRILCNNMTKSKNKNREKGLYQQTYEHDACGVGMVVNIHGNKSHELVDNALKVLENMEHRGAETRDKTGDGAHATRLAMVQALWCRFPTSLFFYKVFLCQKKGSMVQALYFFQKKKKPNRQS